jgi:hypothetical protein
MRASGPVGCMRLGGRAHQLRRRLRTPRAATRPRSSDERPATRALAASGGRSTGAAGGPSSSRQRRSIARAGRTPIAYACTNSPTIICGSCAGAPHPSRRHAASNAPRSSPATVSARTTPSQARRPPDKTSGGPVFTRRRQVPRDSGLGLSLAVRIKPARTSQTSRRFASVLEAQHALRRRVYTRAVVGPRRPGRCPA